MRRFAPFGWNGGEGPTLRRLPGGLSDATLNAAGQRSYRGMLGHPSSCGQAGHPPVAVAAPQHDEVLPFVTPLFLRCRVPAPSPCSPPHTWDVLAAPRSCARMSGAESHWQMPLERVWPIPVGVHRAHCLACPWGRSIPRTARAMCLISAYRASWLGGVGGWGVWGGAWVVGKWVGVAVGRWVGLLGAGVVRGRFRRAKPSKTARVGIALLVAPAGVGRTKLLDHGMGRLHTFSMVWRSS